MIIISLVQFDEMQFVFMLGKGTMDAILILWRTMDKNLAKKKNLYLAFVDLEKAFD